VTSVTVWIIAGVVGYLLVLVFIFALLKAASKPTPPVPPTRPRMRLVRARDEESER
jgi:hypothetical protein